MPFMDHLKRLLPAKLPEREPQYSGSCPIIQRDGAGRGAGLCDHACHDGVCPTHGRISDYPNYDDNDVERADRVYQPLVVDGQIILPVAPPRGNLDPAGQGNAVHIADGKGKTLCGGTLTADMRSVALEQDAPFITEGCWTCLNRRLDLRGEARDPKID